METDLMLRLSLKGNSHIGDRSIELSSDSLDGKDEKFVKTGWAVRLTRLQRVSDGRLQIHFAAGRED
jgi:Lon protease-like protein